jgi:hypothetical protein
MLPMKILGFVAVGALSLVIACSGSDSNNGGDGDGDGDGDASGGTDGSAGASSEGTGGGSSDSTGGTGSTMGGASSGGSDASGGDTGSGGTGEAPDTTARCVGEPLASVETACNMKAAGTPECGMMGQCGNAGGCVPRVSQNECVLRGIGACGTSDGGATCVVKLNDPNDPFKGGTCVQSSHPAGCYMQMDQGACMGFDGGTAADNLCVWEQPDEPTCVAQSCGFWPLESFCTNVPGCEWK